MKVSEKSLELNVGAELLDLFRNRCGRPKAYLRGLTQREEKQEGVDFFVQLDPTSRLFAFQFKAPRGATETLPYRYSLVREQHELLFQLAQFSRDTVFYVFPFYVTPAKLHQDVPRLLQDTWFLDINQMPSGPIFGSRMTRTVRCQSGTAFVNPEYELVRLSVDSIVKSKGILVQEFALWHKRHRRLDEGPQRKRGNPWLVRGLRLVIVAP